VSIFLTRPVRVGEGIPAAARARAARRGCRRGEPRSSSGV